MDLFYLQAIVSELAPLLVGRRMMRAAQIGDKEFALDFNLSDNRWLLISTDQANLTLHLSPALRQERIEQYRTDTQFASLARKYLKSARLEAIVHLGYDRVAILEFTGTDDDGAKRAIRLSVQLTGRSADLILLEGDRPLASLRDREYGNRYSPPPPPSTQLDPYLLDEAQWREIVDQSGGDLYAAARRIIGFTAELGRELAWLSRDSDSFLALRSMLDWLSAPQPVIYTNLPLAQCAEEIGREDFEVVLSAIQLEHLSHLATTTFTSASEAAEQAYRLKRARQLFLARRQNLITRLGQSLKRLESTRGKLAAERARFADADRHQRYGELLLANLHQAMKDGDEFTVTDFFDPAMPSIRIPAAGKADARDAAELYFKLARKARHGLEAIGERMPEIEREIAEKTAQRSEIERAVQQQELDQIAQMYELEKARAVEPKVRGGSKAERTKVAGARCYLSSDGYEILVGRSDRDNDQLTMRVARSFDLWFHAADYPGSHVILRNPQRKTVPHRSIAEAAQLAAKFSQARADARVAVNYCERKYVSKPKGFAPGQVRLSSYKTIMVEPGEPAERVY